jgi:hypothetical protein
MKLSNYKSVLAVLATLGLLSVSPVSYSSSSDYAEFSNGILHMPDLKVGGVLFEDVDLALDTANSTFELISFKQQHRAKIDVILSGGKEVPPLNSMGSAYALFEIDTNTGKLEGTVTVQSLNNITAAHIHLGAPGENGPVQVPLVFQEKTNQFFVPDDTFLSNDQIQILISGNLYVNVHTTDNPSGELRGQLDLDSHNEIHNDGKDDPDELAHENEHENEDEHGDDEKQDMHDDNDDDYNSGHQ